jgi:glycosyltransferase involved in cell wall biosynthesis
MQHHLCIFLPSLDGGGAEKVMLALAGQLVARGVRCDLLVARDEGRLRGQVPAGVQTVVLGRSKPIKAIPSLTAYLRRERPDALLSTIFSANIAALVAGQLAHTRRIVIREANHVTIDTEASSRFSTWLNRLAARFLYRRADAVIAVAQNVRRSLLQSGYVDASRVSVIVNPATFSGTRARRGTIGTGAKTILACGRLEPQKDYPTLLSAFAKLRHRLEVKLVILGEGSLEGELRAMTARLGVQNHVTFAGFDPDASKRMQEADAFVHTATFEGMSNVILEALSVGCPIVATDSVGGVAEVLDNGRYGTLVPVGDAKAVADALQQVLTGAIVFPDAREHLKKFDSGRVAEAYLSVLFPNC